MTTPPPRLARSTTLAGIGFIVFFIGGVVSSSPPGNDASDAKWLASYTGAGNQWSHVTTGVFLIAAAFSLAAFLTGIWQRISATRPAGTTSPVPLVAAGIAATCIAIGGLFMAYIAGSELSGKYPLPSADFLRFSNGFGFSMTGIPGMAATAVCLVGLGYQARAVGLFGRKLVAFTWIVAVLLLASFLFLPIVALMIWIVVYIISSRRASRIDDRPASRDEIETDVRTSAATR